MKLGVSKLGLPAGEDWFPGWCFSSILGHVKMVSPGRPSRNALKKALIGILGASLHCSMWPESMELHPTLCLALQGQQTGRVPFLEFICKSRHVQEGCSWPSPKDCSVGAQNPGR